MQKIWLETRRLNYLLFHKKNSHFPLLASEIEKTSFTESTEQLGTLKVRLV